MSLQKSLEEQAQSIREEAKKVREKYPGIATDWESKPIESQVWECSAEHGQLRFTKRRRSLFLERVFIIAILSCLPPAVLAFPGQPSFLGLFIVFGLSTVPSTILVLRWDVADREYLLDKETDRFCRDGEQLCQLSEIIHVRIVEEWVWEDYDQDVVYVVLRDRKERIPLDLAPEIASYIGVKVYDERETPPSAATGIITLDLQTPPLYPQMPTTLTTSPASQVACGFGCSRSGYGHHATTTTRRKPDGSAVRAGGTTEIVKKVTKNVITGSQGRSL